jgi:hypothetical protein
VFPLRYELEFHVLFRRDQGEMFTPRDMQAAVPQGSVLSSTLYYLYINDSPQTTGVDLALFASDTCQ